jgi:hypothetical protein
MDRSACNTLATLQAAHDAQRCRGPAVCEPTRFWWEDGHGDQEFVTYLRRDAFSALACTPCKRYILTGNAVSGLPELFAILS